MKQGVFNMGIKELYYRFKYRPKKGKSGATGIIYANSKSKNDFEIKAERIASSVSPCYKDNRTVLNYLKSKYNVKSTIPTEAELTMIKANYILNQCPHILTTPEISIDMNGRTPSRNEMMKYQENQQKRFEEAMLYPFDDLGLVISTYSFEIEISDGLLVVFKIVCENNHDDLYVSATANGNLQKGDRQKIQNISDELAVYRGIKQEDIDNKTKNFIIFASAVINLEKQKQIDDYESKK